MRSTVLRIPGSAAFSSVTCLMYSASSSLMRTWCGSQSIMSCTETFRGGGPAPFFALPALSLTVPPHSDFALILDGRLDDFRLANLLHQFGNAALLDELRADVFGEGGELLDVVRVGEEARQEMKALDEAGQQIDEVFAISNR